MAETILLLHAGIADRRIESRPKLTDVTIRLQQLILAKLELMSLFCVPL